jgi:hypothetical protein
MRAELSMEKNVNLFTRFNLELYKIDNFSFQIQK